MLQKSFQCTESEWHALFFELFPSEVGSVTHQATSTYPNVVCRALFFSHTPTPSQDKLAQTGEALEAFLVEKRSSGRPVVCVTAGGTAVPLEANTVRSVDNFSTGRRGAVSAE